MEFPLTAVSGQRSVVCSARIKPYMLKVRFFASLKDLVGESEIEMPLEQETSVREIFQQLEARFPRIKSYQSSMLVAVNMEYADLDAKVTPGDEVCFFPPVSGGTQ